MLDIYTSAKIETIVQEDGSHRETHDEGRWGQISSGGTWSESKEIRDGFDPGVPNRRGKRVSWP